MTGSIGNLSFYYHKDHGFLVREKGGGRDGSLSPRTEENASELGEASRAGKLIRRGIRSSLHVTGDSQVSQRLTSVLSQVLRLDKTSRRGGRRVELGLTTPAGRTLLRSFAFEAALPFEQVLLAPVTYEPQTGSFVLSSFTPGQDLPYCGSATHVQLQGATIYADPATNSYTTFPTNRIVLRLDAGEQEIRLQALKLLHGNGFQLGAVSVVFFEEVNGELLEVRKHAGVV